MVFHSRPFPTKQPSELWLPVLAKTCGLFVLTLPGITPRTVSPPKLTPPLQTKLLVESLAKRFIHLATIEVKEIVLSKSTINDLSAHFSLYSYDKAKDQIFQESIKAVDLELEDLIEIIYEMSVQSGQP